MFCLSAFCLAFSGKSLNTLWDNHLLSKCWNWKMRRYVDRWFVLGRICFVQSPNYVNFSGSWCRSTFARFFVVFIVSLSSLCVFEFVCFLGIWNARQTKLRSATLCCSRCRFNRLSSFTRPRPRVKSALMTTSAPGLSWEEEGVDWRTRSASFLMRIFSCKHLMKWNMLRNGSKIERTCFFSRKKKYHISRFIINTIEFT
jgi:hypothetical protein